MGTGDSQATPDTTSRRYTELGDHRENPVPCGALRASSCERMTWNIRAVCDECWDADEAMGR